MYQVKIPCNTFREGSQSAKQSRYIVEKQAKKLFRYLNTSIRMLYLMINFECT